MKNYNLQKPILGSHCGIITLKNCDPHEKIPFLDKIHKSNNAPCFTIVSVLPTMQVVKSWGEQYAQEHNLTYVGCRMGELATQIHLETFVENFYEGDFEKYTHDIHLLWQNTNHASFIEHALIGIVEKTLTPKQEHFFKEDITSATPQAIEIARKRCAYIFPTIDFFYHQFGGYQIHKHAIEEARKLVKIS